MKYLNIILSSSICWYRVSEIKSNPKPSYLFIYLKPFAYPAASKAYTRIDPSSLDTAISNLLSPALAGRHVICVTALSGVILHPNISHTPQYTNRREKN